MNVNIVLYDGFDMLDALGTAQLFGMAPKYFYVNYCSAKGGLVTSEGGLKVWTEYLIPEEVEEILLIPGGKDIRQILELSPDFMKLLKESILACDRCLMLNEGIDLAAHTGALYRRRIAGGTGNMGNDGEFNGGATMIPGAKIVTDGKFYSCTDAFHSLQMILDVIAEVSDVSVAETLAIKTGYPWNPDYEDEY